MTPIPAPSMDARPAAEADGAAEAFAREAQRQRQDAADPERDGEDEAGGREQDRSRLPAGALWQPPLPPHWNAARLSAGGRHAAEAALSAPGKRGRTLLGEGEGPDAGARGKTAARPQGAQAAAAALAAQHAASLAPTADVPAKAGPAALATMPAAPRKTEHASAKGEASLPVAASQTAAAAPTPGRTVSKAEAAAPVPTPTPAAAREGGETRKTESAPAAAAALTPPPAQPSAPATPPPREAAPQARPRQDPALSQTTPSAPSAPEPAQPGLTYRFQRWGGEHAVNVQSQPGGVLSLQPSDSLVQQRLGEQWQSGNPQQWQMARDDGREQGRQQPQRDEEEDA
ncbi:SpaN/EivJ family type III secretion system needle length determinant [Chromobacterium rhizoryzae]|uniref:SpaN/EivJ family type III secretion system needle length determinant n=1 Tax=Chromobacterium rhizoryzae TaxID=1778675 RepID=UPI001D087FAE|nr:type III secretion system needle length determinant, SpaN/EivJ family [Chromobacterium rhizoryzae]